MRPRSRSPAPHRPDAGRRTGEDQVAGRQFEQAGQFGDDLRHRPDHVGDVAALARLAIDVEADLPALQRRHPLRADGSAPTRRRLVEGLAHLPRLPLFLRRLLQVAPRHVETDGLAEDMAERRRPRRCRGRHCRARPPVRLHAANRRYAADRPSVRHCLTAPAPPHRPACRRRTAARVRWRPFRGRARHSCGRRRRCAARENQSSLPTMGSNGLAKEKAGEHGVLRPFERGWDR